MRKKINWLREPIVIVPAALMGTALVLVPFAVWGQVGAPAFFGSFFAAFVAAGAVIGNSAYQARLADKRLEIDRRDKSLYDALFLWSFLNRVEVQVAGLISTYQNPVFKVGNGGPTADDPAIVDAGTWRRGVIGSMRPNFEAAMSRTALLPKPGVFSVIDCLNQTEHAFVGSFALTYLDDNTCPTRNTLSLALTKAIEVRASITQAKAVLNSYLSAAGAVH